MGIWKETAESTEGLWEPKLFSFTYLCTHVCAVTLVWCTLTHIYGGQRIDLLTFLGNAIHLGVVYLFPGSFSGLELTKKARLGDQRDPDPPQQHRVLTYWVSRRIIFHWEKCTIAYQQNHSVVCVINLWLLSGLFWFLCGSVCFVFLCSVLFCLILWIEPRPLCLLGNHSTTGLYSWCYYFEKRSWIHSIAHKGLEFVILPL